MIDETPKIVKDELYQLLRNDRVDEFNRKRPQKPFKLSGLDLEGIDFSNSYFRQSDLRGLNFKTCNLEGASIYKARISGVYFPDNLSAEEIKLSLEQGTRMRYCKEQ
mgnify:CR=1 FL=1